MTISEYAKRDGIPGSTARQKAREMNVGVWKDGRREITEEEWSEVKASIRPGPGRPPTKAICHD